MYERFTDLARSVVKVANLEAQRFGLEYIGPEHILLGMLKIADCMALRLLRSLSNPGEMILKVEGRMVPSDKVVPGKVPQTPRAKKVIEAAVSEAAGLGKDYVATEHLLLGLLQQNDSRSLANEVLLDMGVTYDAVRELVEQLDGPEGNIPSPPIAALAVLTPEIAQRVIHGLDEILAGEQVTPSELATYIHLFEKGGYLAHHLIEFIRMMRQMKQIMTEAKAKQ